MHHGDLFYFFNYFALVFLSRGVATKVLFMESGQRFEGILLYETPAGSIPFKSTVESNPIWEKFTKS